MFVSLVGVTFLQEATERGIPELLGMEQDSHDYL